MNYTWKERGGAAGGSPGPSHRNGGAPEGNSGLDLDQILRQEFGFTREGGSSGKVLSRKGLLRIGDEALDRCQRVTLLLAQPLLVNPEEESLGSLDSVLDLLPQAGRLALPDLWREHRRSLRPRRRRCRRGRWRRRWWWRSRRRRCRRGGRLRRGSRGRGSRRRRHTRRRSEDSLQFGAAGQRQREDQPHPPD